MSQPQTIEEIMQGIRTQLGASDRDGARNKNIAKTKDTQIAEIMERLRQKSRSPQQADGKKATDAPTPFTLKLHEISQLRAEIQTALEGTQQVGQINPRNPGLINNVIQTVKKVMRRSLTWYTRPLHRFQGGVVRALDQIAAILDNHNDWLREVATELRNHAKAMEEGSVLLTREQAAFEQRSAALEWRIGSLEPKTASLEEGSALLTREQAAFEQRSAALERRIGSLEPKTASLEHKTAAMEQKGAGLELKLDETEKLLEVKLRDASLAHEARIAAAMAAQDAALTAATSPHWQQIARLFEELAVLRSELLKTRAELHEVHTRGRVRDRDVRRTLYSLQHGPARRDNNQPATPPMFASEVKSDKEFDYFAFEELYRGEEADIRSRQQEYLEYFRGRENVVDIGCGRGEFLELLRDNNISARGVELGLDQYLLCKEKGLDVVQQDLFAFLESLSDEALGGLFSAQVLEHLTASDQLRYVALAHRKAMPGSPVIFETINAQCVYAVMRNFFLDPTHIRPVHPETLKFAMETMQFKNVELRFSAPVSDKQIPPLKLNGDTPQLAEFNRSIQELNNLIYGYQDYAAIGWK